MKKIYEVMPLSAKIKRRLFLKFAGVARATVKGTLVVAIAQGALRIEIVFAQRMFCPLRQVRNAVT